MERESAFAAAMDEFKRAKRVEGELLRQMLDAQERGDWAAYNTHGDAFYRQSERALACYEALRKVHVGE